MSSPLLLPRGIIILEHGRLQGGASNQRSRPASDSLASRARAQGVKFAGGMSRPHEGDPSDKKSLLPCTPLAIVKLMEHLKVYDEALPIGDRMQGKSVVVINRSEIVGRPLAAMLANDGADVYSVDLNGVYLMRRGKMIEVCPRPAPPRTAPPRAPILAGLLPPLFRPRGVRGTCRARDVSSAVLHRGREG